jgi:pilin isopeptide linkage protein
MKKSVSKLMALMLIIALVSSFAAFSASAVTSYTPIGGTTTITKNLVVDSDANIPDITFAYTITRGTAKDATETTLEIVESENGTIGNAVFTNADTSNTHVGLPSEANSTTKTTTKKYAQKEITVTFPTTTFTKPGVYRFIINETNGNVPGVTYDTDPRYLDVFVVADSNNALKVESYVLRKTRSDINTSGQYIDNPTEKSAGFTNEITQYDFSFSKAITGNQGDKNKNFTFTLNINNAIPGTYPVKAVNVANSPTTITVDTNRTYTGTFDLTDSSSITIQGLNSGANCTVSENPQDYTATHKVDGGSIVNGSNSGALTLTDSNRSVAFTNTRNGIIPTGVLLTVAPFAIGLLLFGAVGITMLARKKEEE